MGESGWLEPTLPPYLTEAEQRKNADFQWAMRDAEIQRKYAGKIVVVYQKKILGVGKTCRTAWARAQRRGDCPAKQEVAMPVVPYPNPTADE